jgi:uncharacterized membrane protein SpoIIM required for sporulation|nr:stage II sporulation protein M [Candidatus Acidoferrales bacterium]
MPSARWLSKRRPYWERLTELVERSGRSGVRNLSHKELQELGLLYRQAAADLAAVREDPLEQGLARSLNQLLSRAHNLLYAGRKRSGWGIIKFYREDFPRTFRETFNYTLAAALLFLFAGIVSALLTLHDASFERYFLGPEMMETIEHHKMWTESVLTIKPLASSQIMTNNISVCFFTFASGIVAGLGTIYSMLMNGFLMGVIGVACFEANMSTMLWSFVAPHGVLELPAIFISGGAGLLLARGLLFPGLLPRRESLSQAGAKSARLIFGVIPTLIVAGTIEAFLSPTHLPPALKYLFAAALFSLFTVYLTKSGRKIIPTETITEQGQLAVELH